MKGDYITIVDADDYVLPEAFEVCMENMEKYKLDNFGFGSFSSGEGYGGTGKISIDKEDRHLERLIHCLAHEGAIAWGSVFTREVWEGIFYPEGRVFEDSVVAYQLCERMKRCGGIDKEYYFYRKRPGSTCSSSVFKPRTRYDYILACEDRLHFAEKKNLCVSEARSALLKSILSYFTSFYGMGSKKDELYERAMDLLKEQRELPYDENLLNPKYKFFLWCAGRMDFLHNIGGKISVKAQGLKKYRF